MNLQTSRSGFRFVCAAVLGSALSISVTAQAVENGTLLNEARKLAETARYKLTPSPAERKAGLFDCSTFVQEALRRSGFDVGGVTGRTINIVLPSEDIVNLANLVRVRSAKIGGVAQALIRSKQGIAISIEAARPGDVVQLWRIDDYGAVRGHAGIITSANVQRSRIRILGAHNPHDGVGEKEFGIGPRDWSVVFIARPTFPRGG